MGDNFRCDLGTGRTAVAIAAGGYHTCARARQRHRQVLGRNGSGQLGQGDTATRGDGAGEMGDDLATVDLGTGRTAIDDGRRAPHTCAVLDNGTVKCWGENGSGQLGRCNTSDLGDGAGEMGDSLAAVDLGTGRTATVVRRRQQPLLRPAGQPALKCWGANGQGQLGQGDTIARGDNVGEMALLLPVRLAADSHVAPIIDVPLPPTDVAAVAGVGSARVTWEMPEDNGGRPIQGFRVQSTAAGTSTWTTRIVDTGSPALEAIVTGLAGGVGVQFRVAAINVVGVERVPVAVGGRRAGRGAVIRPGRLGPRDGAAGATPRHPGPELHVRRIELGRRAGVRRLGHRSPDHRPRRGSRRRRRGDPQRHRRRCARRRVRHRLRLHRRDPDRQQPQLLQRSDDRQQQHRRALANGQRVRVHRRAAHLLVDVNGYLPAGSHVGTVAPARLLDTRAPNSTIDGLHSGGGATADGSVTEVQITGRGGVPADAIAAILNVTVVGPAHDGFATIFPCLPVPPMTSNLNYAAGHDIPNGAVAQLSPQGTVCVFTDAAAHLLIDVNGYLPAGTSVGTLAPARLLDTRAPNSTIDGLHSGGGTAPAGSVTEVQVTGRGGVPQGAASAILNVTVVGAHADGFATVFDCATAVPTASNVNYTTGRDIPNNTISKLSPSGTVCIFTDAAAHLLVDVNGYAS